ncbi:MAG: ATPase, T2SS/T4P/T4SS family, partial [Candidatus Woesebacteria bacterium]|nr:ATPase, T2SS/T4P/T4SS family [Candidatus Woesebacteria bacterium]
AETGHLVFATLHTNSAAQSIDRIVDVFPEEQQQQVRLQLSNVIEAVFSQRLIQGITKGRVVAYEVMLGSTAIKTAIREGKTHQIESTLETSREIGMSTLERSLADLVKKGMVTLEIAQSWSLRPEELMRLVRST